MEQDKPGAADLLETARALLREELMSHLPASQRLNGLMIANAMAIAARELKAVADMEADAMQSLRGLYPEMENETLSALCKRFADEIRSGGFDDNEKAYRILLANTRERIAIANPRYLAASEK